ncbi:lipoprotein 17-related variable surface protein [Mycoplasmopsis hyopharyngis]|uniref:lipoprotein 17-related variable surface protein n=1 Tax=Mycoplasmopsis hyopharyngis TaxID=29558 RepID=UPI0038736EE4
MKKKGRIILPLGGVVISLTAVSALSASCAGLTQQQVENQTEILFTKTIDKLAQLPSAITKETLKPKVNIENGKVKEYSITTNDAEGKIIVKVVVEVKGKTFTIQKVLEGFKKNSNPADEPIVGENDDEKLANLLKKVSLNVSEGSYYETVAKGKTKVKQGNKWNEVENKTFVHLIIKGTNNKFDQAYLTSANIKLTVKTNITFDDDSNTIFASIEYKTSTGEDKKEEIKVVLQKAFTDEIKEKIANSIEPKVSKDKSCWTITEKEIEVPEFEIENKNLEYTGFFIGYEKKEGKPKYQESLELAKKGEMPLVFKFKDKAISDITYYVTKTIKGLKAYQEAQPGEENSLEGLAKANNLFVLDKNDDSYNEALQTIKSKLSDKKKKWGYIIISKEGIKFAGKRADAEAAPVQKFLKINDKAPDNFVQKIKAYTKKSSQTALYFELEEGKVVINFSITGKPNDGDKYTCKLEE